MSGWTVRPAGRADVPELERIWVDAGRAAWPHILRPETLARLAPPPALRRALEEDDALVLVVEEAGTIAGFADVAPAEPGVAVVRAFFTAPPVWGRGAGRALMTELLAALAARGFRSARLWTAQENQRPRRFYEQSGWRLDGTQRHQAWQGSEFVEVGYRIELGGVRRLQPGRTRSGKSSEGVGVSAEENKALVRRFYEEIDKGNIDAMDELVAEDYLDHSPPPFPGLGSGREGLKQAFRIFWEATPGYHRIEDQVAEGDKVVTRLTAVGRHENDLPGISRTGNDLEMTATVVHRIEDGKLAEKWSDKDVLRFLQQLEVLPALGPTEVTSSGEA